MADEGKGGLGALEKELICSICTEIFYQPLTLLDCLHTFCGSCLKLWFAWQASQAGSRRTNPYTCPSCRATVRGTRPDARVTTLLDICLRNNPSMDRSKEEKEDIAKKYTPGENIIPKPGSRSAAEEQRMVDEVRGMSLREGTSRGLGAYERGSNHASAGRDRRREDATTEGPARHVEHQASLRSMISSSSDGDSSGMVEAVLRQITEDGLLEGIDLGNIDATQLEELSERIAHAYRQRHGPQAGSAESRRAHERGDPESASRRRSRSTGRQHARSAGSQDRPQVTSPSQSSTSSHRQLLSPTSPDSGSHRRTSSETRNERRRERVPSTDTPTVRGQTARSASDIQDRPPNTRDRDRRPSDNARQRRRSTEPPPDTLSPRSGQSRGSTSPRSRHSPQASPRTIDPATAPIPTASPPAELPATESGRARDTQPAELRDPGEGSDAPQVVTTESTASPYLSPRTRPTLFAEPSISCDRCGKGNLQYELHEFCATCQGGQFTLCHRCYRSGKGCLHWFGFGNAAWHRFQSRAPSNMELPHGLTGRQYIRPRPESVQSVQAAGDSDHRILTTEDPAARLRTGAFCSICKEYADDCYWKCDVCNDAEWGFCNNCVNQGRCCSHPLLPLAPVSSKRQEAARTASNRHSNSHFAPLTSPRMVQNVPSASLNNSRQYRPLTFSVNCDICHYPIVTTQHRYHCYSCNSGDYDICQTCYTKLVDSGRISAENGDKGWRRCLQGHRMIVLAFEDTPLGQYRILTRDLVGGIFLKDEATGSPRADDAQRFSWLEDGERKTRTLKRDLSPRVGVSNMGTAPASTKFPPDGGVGLWLQARWAWLPEEGVTDELTFPRGAEIREALEISSEWYMGAYAGAKGVFPSNFVITLGAVTM